jgi:hypothetical protein
MPLRLEDLSSDAPVTGLIGREAVRIVSVQMMGEAADVVYRDGQGNLQSQVPFRDYKAELDLVARGRKWSFQPGEVNLSVKEQFKVPDGIDDANARVVRENSMSLKSNSCPIYLTTIMRLIPGLLAISTTFAGIFTPSLARELSTQEAVHALAVALTWAGEQAFNQKGKFPSPQILFGIGGTYAYGSCQSASGSTRIPGSFYCEKTNTIVLEYQQLETLRSRFGDGAVVYALAHEYAHYLQKVFGLKAPITIQELQADCMAGAILKASEGLIGLDQGDIQEVILTAAAIGGGDHGSPEQRASAVMLGLEHGDISVCSTKKPDNSTKNPHQPRKIKAAPTTKTVSIKPRQPGTPHPGGNVTFIGIYPLWFSKMVPIYKDNMLSPRQGGSMTIKMYNDYDGKWQSFVTYVDCKLGRFSFFPDLPTSQYSYTADAKMLSIAKCK